MGLFDVIEEAHAIQRDHEMLQPLLEEFLYEPRNTKIQGPDDWLPASAMGTWCPRWHVMAWRMGLREATRDLDAQARWAIDRGTAFHRVFQELWMGPMGWLYGGWRCPTCGHLHISTSTGEKDTPLIEGWKSPVTPKNAVLMPKRCERCNHKSSKFDPFRFEEPWCRNMAEKVRGPCDGILHLPGNAVEFFDLKTTGNLKYVRKEPRIKDVIQLHWYMDAYDIRRGRIIYVNTGAKRFDEAIAEHIVPFDSTLMTKEKRKIRDLREALQKETRPVPACPYGGKLPFGDCVCVDLAVQWARRRLGSVSEERGGDLADALGTSAADAHDSNEDRPKGERSAAD